MHTVINDFEPPKAKKQYSAIHIFFTSRTSCARHLLPHTGGAGVADAALQKLSSSAAASSIETLKELNLEYLCMLLSSSRARNDLTLRTGPEGEVFHFDLPTSMQRVYAGAGQEDTEIRALARKVEFSLQSSTAILTMID